MQYVSQLEPSALIDHFIQHPPVGFSAWREQDKTPIFTAPFDLLTSLEPDLRRAIIKFPGYNLWSKWLQPYTCFIGTTVSEYTLIPTNPLLSTTETTDLTAQSWVQILKHLLTPRYSFVIIKDIPQNSPLLSSASNQTCAAVTLAAKKQGFILLEGQALAWVPIDFTSIDDYLNRLSKASRKSLKRKLKSQADLAISYIATGATVFLDEELLQQIYQLYLNVVAQSDTQFDLLTLDFFTALLQDSHAQGVVIMYRVGDLLIGYNICFVENNKLIDKYVGFLYPQARTYNVYFVSWFINLEYALDHYCSHYVAGWTDPEVKKSLGAKFTFTTHAVYIRNPVVRVLLKPWARLFERDRLWREQAFIDRSLLDKKHNKTSAE